MHAQTTESRILVFGLSGLASTSDVRTLLGCSTDVRIQLCAVPGDEGQSYAVLHVQTDAADAWQAAPAWRLAAGIRQRRLHGRRLQAWVPAMPWA